MSRCFPFPPPGYDKKDTADDVNLIIKEKDKHKHKKNKDKKDKGKKERSERKEKGRSESKDKDDKERKQKKHKEKKDKKKDKHKSSDEKKIVEELFSKENGDKILAELGKRVRNDDEATENQMVQNNTLVEQREVNLQAKVEDSSNRILPNGQNLEFGAKGLENGFVGNLSRENQNKVEGGFSTSEVEKVEKKKEGKEKNRDRKSDGKEDGRKNEDRDKNRKEEKKRKKEKKERSIEEIKLSGNGDSFLESREASILLKEPKLNGFSHDNEKRPGNMSRPTFSSHQVGQNGSDINSSQNIINSSFEKGPVITNHKGLIVEKGPVITNHKGLIVEKGPVIKNGLMPSDVAKWEHGVVKNRKAGDKIPSPHSFSENGQEKMEPKVGKGLNLQGPDFNRGMEHKEVKINGRLEGKKHTALKPSSMKPPHPDSKYLSEILDIPKVEWPQFDDEEWLFGCKDTKRPKLDLSCEIERIKPVWAEAIRLESEDVIALPYVIPY